MGFLLELFNRHFPEEIELDPEFEAVADKHIATFAPSCEPTILDRSATAVTNLLSDARNQIVRLDAEIAERQEQRRMALVILDTFEPTLPKLEAGYDTVLINADAESWGIDLREKNRRPRRTKTILAAAE